MSDSSRDCIDIRSILADYAVGSLRDSDRLRVRRHVQDCEHCAAELQAIEATGALLDQAVLTPAPDQWEAIQAGLRPRKSTVGSWLARHRLQSALAATASVVAIAAGLLFSNRPPAEVEAQTLFVDHATMSWREPFADRAALGLAVAVPVEKRSEDTP